MNFSVIQSKVLDRLNLTSTQATARVADSINEAYRRMAGSLGGFSTIERQIVTAHTTIGLQTLTFNCEKIIDVFNPALVPFMVLNELTFEELRNEPNNTDPAENYAIQTMGAGTVTIFLDTIPGSVYQLNADAMVNLITLSGVMVPAFSEDYHDILQYHAMAVELEKMEKYDLADKQEKLYEKRISEYRLYVAISSWKDIYQGKDEVTDSYFVPLIP